MNKGIYNFNPSLNVQLLSCGPSEHEAGVSGVLAERSTLLKERKALEAELAQLHAGNLVAQLDAPGELCSLTRTLREFAHGPPRLRHRMTFVA